MRLRQLERFFPNLVVFFFSYGLGGCVLFYIIPNSVKIGRGNLFFGVIWAVVLFFLLMWTWCWLVAAISDPGRTEDDLNARGLLERVKQGDIPQCLRHLPICVKCQMPKPPLSHHCASCNACHLRMDHHCGVTGQCVADKNMKAFVLSFIYAFCLGLSMFIAGLGAMIMCGMKDTITVIIMVYSGMLGVLLLGFGASFIRSGMNGTGTIDKMSGNAGFGKLSFKKYMNSFGKTWVERLIPVQHFTTFLAWPGVNWEDLEYYA